MRVRQAEVTTPQSGRGRFGSPAKVMAPTTVPAIVTRPPASRASACDSVACSNRVPASGPDGWRYSPLRRPRHRQLTGATAMPPLFGYHMPSFTFPGDTTASAVRAGGRARRRGGSGGLRPRDRDGPLLPDPRGRGRDRAHARGVLDARRARGPNDLGAPRSARDRRDLPQPGHPGQDRDHAGRHLGRSGDARHRGCLERG